MVTDKMLWLDEFLNRPKWGMVLEAILFLGLVSLLAGPFVFDRDAYKRVLYLILMLPSLCLLLNFSFLKRFIFPSAMLFTAFLIYMVLSASWGGGAPLDYLKRPAYILLGLVFFSYCYIERRHVFDVALKTSVIMISLYCYYWLYDFYIVRGYSFGVRFGAGLEYGIFYNPLLLDHVVAFFCCFYPFVYFSKGRRDRLGLLAFIFMAPIFLMMLATGSRTGVLTFVGSLAVFFILSIFFKFRKNAFVDYKMVGFLILLCSVFFAAIYLFKDTRFISRGSSCRFDIWSAYWEQIVNNPWFGYGFKSSHENISYCGNAMLNDAHNIFMQVLFEGGVVGFVLLSLVYLYAAYDGLKGSSIDILLLVMVVVGVLGISSDGGGVLSRPNEHWFNFYLPVFFLVTRSMEKRINRAEYV